MDQKLENILNLALETPEEEREQTESLNVGYSAESRSWELIVNIMAVWTDCGNRILWWKS